MSDGYVYCDGCIEIDELMNVKIVGGGEMYE